MINFLSSISIVSLSFILLTSLSPINTQQPYIGLATTSCESPDTSNSILGYKCNNPTTTTCQSYLYFRSTPPYNTISSISTLFSINPSNISLLNSVSESKALPTNSPVLIPVTCSCSGEFYQKNTSYTIKQDDSYFIVANTTFQGLSTCQALQNENNIAPRDLSVGARIRVPIRCACPTKNQTDKGVKFLLSYLVGVGDFVSTIGEKFGVDVDEIAMANELSGGRDNQVYPSTTLLIPLDQPPVNSPAQAQPPILSNPSPTPSSSGSKAWIYALIGVFVGITLLVIAGIIIFRLFFRKGKEKNKTTLVPDKFHNFEARKKPKKKKLDEESSQLSDRILSGISKNLKVYNYTELQSATDNFNAASRIKGSVYRGKINGDYAAIKKFDRDISKEIDLLNKINHFNLVTLTGICFHDGIWYLVSEFASNGSLSDSIFHKKNLSWTQRIQILVDVATGLNYLHSYTNPTHIHKNINLDNILLDNDFRGKIINFASSGRIMVGGGGEHENDDFVLTKHIVGTKGYMAPEYLEHGLVSTKLDVYSFGVLMLEVISGKEVCGLSEEEKTLLLDGSHELTDFSSEEHYAVEFADILRRLILDCLKKEPTTRPTMDQIVRALSRFLMAFVELDLSEKNLEIFSS